MLRSLGREVDRRTAALRKRRKVFTPFHQLSVEIYVQPLLEAARDQDDRTRRTAQLCFVCTRWWQVIEDTPSLWSSIKLLSQSVRVALRRSRNAPLDILADGDLSWDPAGDTLFLQYLVPHAHRWLSICAPRCYGRSLFSALSSPLPLLKTSFSPRRTMRLSRPSSLGGPAYDKSTSPTWIFDGSDQIF